MSPPEKDSHIMMPNYLNTHPGHSDFLEYNRLLDLLPTFNGSNQLLINGSSEEEEDKAFPKRKRQSEIPWYYSSKRPRIERAIKLDAPPWNHSSRLPPLQSSPDSTHKLHIPLICLEAVSSNDRRFFDTSTTAISSNMPVDEGFDTGSGRSGVSKVDVMDSSPLDNKHVQGFNPSTRIETAKKPDATYVYSFEDLGIQVEERLPSHEIMESGVDILEPIKCDETTKCEVYAKTVSPKERNKRDVSVVERFTEEEIKLHIRSLKKGNSEEGIRDTRDLKEDPCQLCGVGPLMFPAQPIYCSFCTRRIKGKSDYYIPEEKVGDVQHQICNNCYNRSKSEFTLYGISISKAKMLKRKNVNNENTEEWVCCGSCGKWQHLICGLYNKNKDTDKTADYICPHCLLEERKSINNTGFHDNTDLGAKDLPETILSYFIEQRLFRRLKEERQQTAMATGKSINDVSEPEDLTLRVVFSADSIIKANKQLADLLRNEHYPSEFPYGSKVILLFQKVDGVDICIFALFVQEFGSECSQPNQRSVYFLYLDSVKYFRPERATFSGEALRTFVYHEILIGYLEYCKIRGFTMAYIWACPPTKGVDYVMYSHPKTQQTPNTKKLRQWYMSMLHKATEQRVVTNVTNLYDRFFIPAEECNCNITAARLPYFEGSSWSINAELLLQEIEKEGDDELQKKAKMISRRKVKGPMRNKGKDCVDVRDARNILLMQKLGKKISPNKKDFILVELNYSCTRCSEAILSGLRWICNKCKNLQLCERCHDAEQEVPGEHTHNVNDQEKHSLSKVQVNGIQSTTEDNDIILENNIFGCRQTFLTFSQKNNYNFDTLRRAKYSSMMILHHLHTSHKHQRSQNSTGLFQVTCTGCKKDVSKSIYFPCLICPGYRACTGCYAKNKVLRLFHLFPITPITHGTVPRTVEVLEILDAMLHAQLCRPTATKPCTYPKCSEVKTLFRHSAECKIKDREACKICGEWWSTLRIHSYHCQDPKCPIPPCRDMKEHFTRNVKRL